MLDGKGRKHGQHNTGFNTKTRRKQGVLTINYNTHKRGRLYGSRMATNVFNLNEFNLNIQFHSVFKTNVFNFTLLFLGTLGLDTTSQMPKMDLKN